ncbi:MAG: twin-arginine translocase subunit TatC [Chloroflexota bacterium]|nr:twin-arginine translocase subunit TatC [Chloroflexota bacterium]
MPEIVRETGGPSRAVTPDAILPPVGSASTRSDPPASQPLGPGPDGAGRMMSLGDHLSELRRRVAVSILAVMVGSGLGFWLSQPIILLLLQPLPGGQVQILTVTGGFMIHLRIALVVGVLLALPLLLYQLWAFVAPGLTERERRAAAPWLPMTILFFLLGVGVAYVTLPYAVQFLAGFQIADALVFGPSAEAYFGFVFSVFMIFGVAMQFPTVLVLLAKLGILDVDRLRRSRRYALLGMVIFAVVITPGGDPISPAIMSSVMYLLFEATILLLHRTKGRTRPAQDRDP